MSAREIPRVHTVKEEEPSMNEYYLMQHVSRHLHTLIRRYSHSWEMTDTFCARADLQDGGLGSLLVEYFSDPESVQDISPDLPVFLSVNNQAVYACIPVKEARFLLGPVFFSTPAAIRRHKTVPVTGNTFQALIPVCHFQDFIADVLLIANLFRSEIISEESVLAANCINPQIADTLEQVHVEHTFQNRESGRLHNPYDQEIREFTSIEKGNLTELKNSLSEDYPGEVGRLAQTPLRHIKNRGIVVLTLACRAAIRGGILPEEAFSLSDTYIQKIEECTDVPTVLHLFHSAEYRYAQMVRDRSLKDVEEKRSSRYTEDCKTYIFSHLHEKLRVCDIARELNINANYLSELFHSLEGITITDYIQREKIKLTQNLLIYSKYTYSEIAAYLGYSSQSHLGRRFKQHTGITMCQYRSQYGKKQF